MHRDFRREALTIVLGCKYNQTVCEQVEVPAHLGSWNIWMKSNQNSLNLVRKNNKKWVFRASNLKTSFKFIKSKMQGNSKGTTLREKIGPLDKNAYHDTMLANHPTTDLTTDLLKVKWKMENGYLHQDMPNRISMMKHDSSRHNSTNRWKSCK